MGWGGGGGGRRLVVKGNKLMEEAIPKYKPSTKTLLNSSTPPYYI